MSALGRLGARRKIVAYQNSSKQVVTYKGTWRGVARVPRLRRRATPTRRPPAPRPSTTFTRPVRPVRRHRRRRSRGYVKVTSTASWSGTYNLHGEGDQASAGSSARRRWASNGAPPDPGRQRQHERQARQLRRLHRAQVASSRARESPTPPAPPAASLRSGSGPVRDRCDAGPRARATASRSPTEDPRDRPDGDRTPTSPWTPSSPAGSSDRRRSRSPTSTPRAAELPGDPFGAAGRPHRRRRGRRADGVRHRLLQPRRRHRRRRTRSPRTTSRRPRSSSSTTAAPSPLIHLAPATAHARGRGLAARRAATRRAGAGSSCGTTSTSCRRHRPSLRIERIDARVCVGPSRRSWSRRSGSRRSFGRCQRAPIGRPGWSHYLGFDGETPVSVGARCTSPMMWPGSGSGRRSRRRAAAAASPRCSRRASRDARAPGLPLGGHRDRRGDRGGAGQPLVPEHAALRLPARLRAPELGADPR